MTTDRRPMRERVLSRVRRRLGRRGFPRLEMALIVCATGGAAFLSSAGLLQLGVHAMALRYPMAVVAGYGVFLVCLWIWLKVKRGSLDLDLDPDMADLAESSLDGGWDLPEGTDSALGGVDFGADELVLVLAVLAAVLAAAIAAGYIIVTAPALLAEVLLDGALSYGLYRRLRGLDRRHWLESAFSRTIVPFAVVAVFSAVAGAVMQWYAPAGDSIGDVWKHFLGKT